MLIFLATQDMVDFYTRFLQVVLWGEEEDEEEQGTRHPPLKTTTSYLKALKLALPLQKSSSVLVNFEF